MQITKLLAKLADQPLIPPRDVMPEGARVLGELPEELRRLHSLRVAKQRGVEVLTLEHRHTDDSDKREELRSQLIQAAVEVMLISNLLDYEIGAVYSLPTDGHIGVNSTWEVWSVAEMECGCPICTQAQLLRFIGSSTSEPEGTFGQRLN